jgi:hypothetical protein
MNRSEQEFHGPEMLPAWADPVGEACQREAMGDELETARCPCCRRPLHVTFDCRGPRFTCACTITGALAVECPIERSRIRENSGSVPVENPNSGEFGYELTPIAHEFGEGLASVSADDATGSPGPRELVLQ